MGSKLYESTDSFVYAQTSLMSFGALKQYFRSRHGKTSYTEEEPPTLFFLRLASPGNKILTFCCIVCIGVPPPYISGEQLTEDE